MLAKLTLPVRCKTKLFRFSVESYEMKAMVKPILIALGIVQIVLAMSLSGFAQEKSVKPGINDSFKDPKVQEYIATREYRLCVHL